MKRRSFLQTSPLLVGGIAAATSTAANACTPTASPRVNVKDFCAVGDGVTDDTTAIVNAINSFTGGGVVYFPPGRYKISSTITLKPNLTLIGESRDNTVLLAANNNQTMLALHFTVRTMAAVEISGIQLSADGRTNVTGIAMTHPEDVRLSNLLFVGCYDNVKVDRCFSFTISNCRSSGDLVRKAGRLNFYSSVTNSAADQYPHCSTVTIDNYYIYNTGSGVSDPSLSLSRMIACNVVNLLNNDAHVGGSANVIVFLGDCQGCSVIGGGVSAGQTAVYFGADATEIVPSFCTVSDLEIDQFRLAGIRINEGNWITVSNCMVTSSGAALSASGVLLEKGYGNIIHSNTFNGFTSGQGVLAGVNVTNSSIINNQFWSINTGVGIVPGGSATGFNITGNTFALVTTPILQSLTPGNNLVRNNIGVADQI